MLLGPFGTDNEEPVFRFNRPLISNFKKNWQQPTILQG
ncbi:hypothetical protein [Amylolactobacillus amylophilus]